MNPKQEQKHNDADNQFQGTIETPAPPQVVDTSKLPGEGEHETYGKGDHSSTQRQPGTRMKKPAKKD